MPTYDQESYIQSLINQRADVDAAVAQAQAEIDRQRNTGTRRAGQLGGKARAATRQAGREFGSDLGAGNDFLRQLGLFQGVDGAGLTKSARRETGGDLRGISNAYGKAGGLLQKGFKEQAMQRRGQVDSISKSLYGDIDSKRNEYIARREAEDRQRALQDELSRRQQAMQQQALAQQAAIARQQMSQQAGLAAAARLHQEKQAQQAFLWESLKQRAPDMGFEDVQALHAFGFAPPGMDVNAFADFLGIAPPPPPTSSGYRAHGGPSFF